jgi:hypothetical protein
MGKANCLLGCPNVTQTPSLTVRGFFVPAFCGHDSALYSYHVRSRSSTFRVIMRSARSARSPPTEAPRERKGKFRVIS